MAISTMYPAKAGSPKTSLAEALAADATTMTLDDASVLPSAPNLAVIGSDETAEVVSYTSIVGNVVYGLVRGLGGTTASAWAVNTEVARNYTSFDHDRFILNIEDLEDNKADVPLHFQASATAGSSLTYSNASITSTMRLVNCVFGSPSSVSSNVTWTTATGAITFTGTFTGATTIDFDLIDFG